MTLSEKGRERIQAAVDQEEAKAEYGGYRDNLLIRLYSELLEDPDPEDITGQIYEDADGVWKVTEVDGEDLAKVLCVQEGNPHEGRTYYVPVEVAYYYLNGGRK